MKQEELDNDTTTLKCCLGKLGYEIANSLFIGGCDRTKELVLLDGYIRSIEVYDLENTDTNCLTEIELKELISKGKNICNSCGCNN